MAKRNDSLDALADMCAALSHSTVVDIIKSQYPSFDKTMLSKCLKPDKYGCQLAPGAMKLLKDRAGCTVRPKERRKLPFRASVRFTDGEYRALMETVKMSGSGSVQDFLRRQVLQTIKEDGSNAT